MLLRFVQHELDHPGDGAGDGDARSTDLAATP